MVNGMEEVEHRGCDKIVPTDVTVSVTCKHIYPTSATNWANDLFANRYLFRNEHEMSLEVESDSCFRNRAILPSHCHEGFDISISAHDSPGGL